MNKTKLIYIIHAAIWTIMFISPLMFMNHGNGVTLREFLRMSGSPLALCIVFYINYLWLTHRLFADDRKYYFIANSLIIVSMGIALHYWMTVTHQPLNRPPHIKPPEFRMMPFFLVLRNIFNLIIAAAIATTVQLAMKWQESENARREAEGARTQAELRNLRSQINPHFLLNTLNNIYALISFNSSKAQEALQELSKMLQYVLYDNQSRYVNLEKEVQFLTNYINLMKIRLSGNVDVRLNVNIPSPCHIQIAPLIFISLIENAFKHGMSPTAPSFIHITLEADEQRIICSIDNSNFPKNENDRSGHGIGLQQVARRLELDYPGKYEWSKKTDAAKTVYSSKIIIYDTKLCYNRR